MSAGVAVISAGFFKTHVTTAAREASDRGLLALAITAAYPTRRCKQILRLTRMSDRGRLARLLERDEQIPDERVHALFVPELLDEAARALTRRGRLRPAYERAGVAARRLYGRRAGTVLTSADGARIYQFRAGFGGESIDRARQMGMVTLCDQALAHPMVLPQLVEHGGRLPAGPVDDPVDAFSEAVLADIDRSDAVVVNSDFVKETFVRQGSRPDRVHVVYLGVDENFARAVPVERQDGPSGPLRLLFAGAFERRKGADVLVRALAGLSDVDWRLRVVGPIPPESASAHASFLRDERVEVLGVLRRADLAREMARACVFVFPSLAEGSARVVFEALACGCYVITTPNAGTVVEDGVHGAIVPPGDPQRLAAAIAAADGRHDEFPEIAQRGRHLVRTRYRQVHYGDALAVLYRDLLATSPGG